MAQLTVLLQQFTARYRRALLTNAAVRASAGVVLIGSVAWKLHRLDAPSLWRIGVPIVLAAIGGAGVAWRLWRRWMSTQQAAHQLDRALGLQQRLITAEEFAAADPPPSLYPLLVADVERCWRQPGRLPRPFDGIALALVVLLLLILLWPVGASRLRVAQVPQNPLLKPPPPPQRSATPPQPSQSQPQAQSASSSQTSPSQQPQSAQQGGEPSGSGAQQQQRQQPAAAGDAHQSSQQPRSGASSKQQQQQTGSFQGGTGAQPSDRRPAGDSGTDRAQRGGQGTQKPQGTEGGGRQQQPANSQERAGRDRQAGQSPTEQSSADQGSTQAAAQQGGQGGGSNVSEAAAASQQQAGGGIASAHNEALKTEIQQLLQEVSGQLEELQAQLESAQQQVHPEAGTTTDPTLYDASASRQPNRAAGGPLPIHLATDEAEVSAQRPGGGVGTPSGRVAGDAPQAAPEEAQLSDQPLEEPSAARQPVPPEYRSVFDRLQRPDAQPSETTP